MRKLPETENFAEKFKHFRTMRDWHDCRATYTTSDESALTGEAREIALKNADTWKRNVFSIELVSSARKLEIGVCGRLEDFSPRILTLADHKAHAQQIPLSSLKYTAENQKTEINRIDEVCDSLTNNYLRPEVEANVNKDQAFDIKIGGATQSFMIYKADLADFQARIREKIEILREAKKFHEELATVYSAELASRESQSSEVIKLAVKEANAIIKEAEKLSKTITQAAEKCKTAGFTDLEAVEKFVSAMDRFEEIKREYSTIGPKIAKVVRTEDVAKTLPLFPTAPKCGFNFNLDSKIRSFRNQREYVLLTAKKE